MNKDIAENALQAIKNLLDSNDIISRKVTIDNAQSTLTISIEIDEDDVIDNGWNMDELEEDDDSFNTDED